ncbi:periplasmic heavy metal sensor [Corticibacterium sp. UT-5YL-CI-8]|nr:periplasmic heavy metal sensor [Tianweitania sp. UT-5YL-CI-8]
MTPRTRTVLLAASLALNLFLIGGLAGGTYIFSTRGPEFTGQRAIRFAADGLSDEQRKAFRQSLMQARRDSVHDVQAGRVGRQDLNGLMRAESLDRGAIDTALAGIRKADTALRQRLETAIVDFAATLTPTERQAFVDGLESRTAMLRRSSAQEN